ncbi:MAG: ATP-binding protein [Chloroflexota bacterium]
MRLLTTIGRRLGWKLFISYLVVIVVGVVSLAVTAELSAPSALVRHTGHMEGMMGGSSGMMDDLLRSFRTAVNEVLAVAALAAFITAVAVSTFVTRRIVGPIQQMQQASQRIAAGDYQERVTASSQDELGALADAFNQMAQQLEQTEQRRRQLIGDAAHELRTPLSSIKSVMEGLVDGVLPAEPATFVNLQREVSRLQRLVHDLEELSRAEAGQIPLEWRTLDVAALVEAAAGRLRPQFADKGVVLLLDMPPGLPEIEGDSGRLTQVLLNLLGNALQYTPAGGRVTIQLRAEGRHVIIRVQDTGLGLAPEHLSHIFERFYRVDKSRSRAGGGSGVGLTIAKYLVEAHGGRLAAASPGLGQGSTFTITLNVKREK